MKENVQIYTQNVYIYIYKGKRIYMKENAEIYTGRFLYIKENVFM